MILIDKPYISDLFRDTIIRNRFPVIDTAVAREMGFGEQACLIDEARHEPICSFIGFGHQIHIGLQLPKVIGFCCDQLLVLVPVVDLQGDKDPDHYKNNFT